MGNRRIDLSPSLCPWCGHSSHEGRKYIRKNFRQSQFSDDSDKQGMAGSVKGLENIAYSEMLQEKRTKRRLRTQFITVYGDMDLLGYSSGATIDAKV